MLESYPLDAGTASSPPTEHLSGQRVRRWTDRKKNSIAPEADNDLGQISGIDSAPSLSNMAKETVDG